MSSHPGSDLNAAVELALYLRDTGHQPEQVQDFYPTPGTLSTCMFYTGLDPRTMKSVYVPRTAHEKAMQRALLQFRKPQNRHLVLEALRSCGREDLIGYDRDCLVRPMETPSQFRPEGPHGLRKSGGMERGTGRTPVRNAGKNSSPKGTAAPAPARSARPAKPKYSSKWAKAKKK